MSKQLIQQYRSDVEKLIRYGGSRNESVVRKAFQELLDHYARSKNLLLVPEIEFITKQGFKVYPDGTLKDALRQSWGFWESKDEKDNIEDEIASKFAKGYPNFNIIFEDTHTAILYQNGERVMTASFSDDNALDVLLNLFVGYEPPEVREFHKAIEQFKLDVPELAETLREIIKEQSEHNPLFGKNLDDFLALCRKAINPSVEMTDVHEMVIQHILTEDIFMRVFDEVEFHRENIIARKLQEVAGTFYKGATKRDIDARIVPYYQAINARASQISDHHEKQKFLKALYENFYKSYNPKAADRLGVIYTPDEIVRFMIESTDSLLYTHFGKTIGDPYVEILDPATGTGTFITELIEYLSPIQLDSKYETEIHCNEVAILPYYIANLNIEYTYQQKRGKYKEFENICFVDTLDNMGFSRADTHQLDFFGLWDENFERIGRQNTRKISVIIGNPPYNANQLNENENNKNREYPAIDQRIRETYIKHSTAKKTKLYDMYARFYRWASDRLDRNGIIAFITNNSFLDSRTFDGFRKIIEDEFNFVYIIDLGGNIRKNPKLSGPTHNVFAIQTGVAIAFLIKKPKSGKAPAKIFYYRRPEMELAKDKLEYLRNTTFPQIQFDQIIPDLKHNWLNQTHNDWDTLIPVTGKDLSPQGSSVKKNSIFTFSSIGVSTNRDEWVFDLSSPSLEKKINFLIEHYSEQVASLTGLTLGDVNRLVDYSIKWSETLKRYAIQGKKISYNPDLIRRFTYRPFFDVHYYSEKCLSDRLTSNHFHFFGEGLRCENLVITFSGTSSSKKFSTLITNKIFSKDLLENTQGIPLYIYDDTNTRMENITDWALRFMQKHYHDKRISKMNIFHYVYSIFHHPLYLKKYELNLRQEFPRIPLYENFWLWVNWGEQLMKLHINLEEIPKYDLTRLEKNPSSNRKPITPRLISHKDDGFIEIDTLTTLSGIPHEAWEYRLGTYSAIEWILERYKENQPKDQTIREHLNTYRFADYKEQVIDMICRVCTVSVETMKIINQMPT